MNKTLAKITLLAFLIVAVYSQGGHHHGEGHDHHHHHHHEGEQLHGHEGGDGHDHHHHHHEEGEQLHGHEGGDGHEHHHHHEAEEEHSHHHHHHGMEEGHSHHHHHHEAEEGHNHEGHGHEAHVHEEHSHEGHNHEGHSHEGNSQGEEEESYMKITINWLTSKLMQDTDQKNIAVAIFFISAPSIPIFFLFLIISKLFGKSNKGLEINPFILKYMICFGFGTLLGDVLLHIIPHLIEKSLAAHLAEHAGHDHGEEGHSHSIEQLEPYLYIIFGIFVFYVLDITFTGGHDHGHDNGHGHSHGNGNNKQGRKNKNKNQKHSEEEEKTTAGSLIFLIGDFLHNFSDGLSVGAAFALNIKLGFTTTIACMLHEIPHEIGDFAVFVKKKWSLFDILKTQILTSMGAWIGGLVGYQLGVVYEEKVLAVAAGGFLYLSLSGLVPEMKSQKRGGVISMAFELLCMMAGVQIMVYIALNE